MQKFSFLMGLHKRVGARSTIFSSFSSHYLCDENVLSLIFGYIDWKQLLACAHATNSKPSPLCWILKLRCQYKNHEFYVYCIFDNNSTNKL